MVLFREKQEKQYKNMWTEIRKRQYLWGIKLSLFSPSAQKNINLHYIIITMIKTWPLSKQNESLSSIKALHTVYATYMLEAHWHDTDFLMIGPIRTARIASYSQHVCLQRCVSITVSHGWNIHPLRIVETNWTPFQWIKLGWHNQFYVYFPHEAR